MSKKPINVAAEIRKQNRLEKLDTLTPRCLHCGEDDERCLEDHHIADQNFDDQTIIECRNCHRKLSDMQKDHPKPSQDVTQDERIAHFLLGLADLFELLVGKLKGYAAYLLSSPAKPDQKS